MIFDQQRRSFPDTRYRLKKIYSRNVLCCSRILNTSMRCNMWSKEGTFRWQIQLKFFLLTHFPFYFGNHGSDCQWSRHVVACDQERILWKPTLTPEKITAACKNKTFQFHPSSSPNCIYDPDAHLSTKLPDLSSDSLVTDTHPCMEHHRLRFRPLLLSSLLKPVLGMRMHASSKFGFCLIHVLKEKIIKTPTLTFSSRMHLSHKISRQAVLNNLGLF